MLKNIKHINTFGAIAVIATAIFIVSTVAFFVQTSLPSLFHDPSLNNYYNNGTNSKPNPPKNTPAATKEISDEKSESVKENSKAVNQKETSKENKKSSLANETEISETIDESKETTEIEDTSETTDTTSSETQRDENDYSYDSYPNNDDTDKITYYTPESKEPESSESHYEESYVSESKIEEYSEPELPAVIDKNDMDDIDKAYAALYTYDYPENNELIINELTDIGSAYGMSLNTSFDASCFHDGTIHPIGEKDISTYTAAVTWKTNPDEIRNKTINAFSNIMRSQGDLRGKEFNVIIINYINLAMPASRDIQKDAYAIVILYT